jgi:hypothetical protein
MKAEAGHAGEMREGGKKKTSSITTDARALKVQARDARVERQRAREHSATRLKEVGFVTYVELREGRVAALDAPQQLPRQVRVIHSC